MFERFAPASKSVLVRAKEHAERLHHAQIGTEHILLGLLDIAVDDVEIESAFMMSWALASEVREQLLARMPPGVEEPPGPRPFSAEAKQVLELGLREALALGDAEIRPLHLLLGILRTGTGIACQTLMTSGVTQVTIHEPRQRGRRGRRPRIGALGQSLGYVTLGRLPGTRRALGAAERAAGRDPVATHHLLLGLLEEGEGLAAKALAALGVTKEAVEAKIAEIGVEGTSDAPPPKPAPPRTIVVAPGIEVRITDAALLSLGDDEAIRRALRERLNP